MELCRKFFFRLTVVIIGLGLTVTVALGLFTLALIPDLPEIETINDIQLKVPLRVYSKEGLLIAEYGDERRIPVSIDDLPDTLVDAILAAEDSAFYEHPGVDFIGVLRAIIANLQSGEHGQGASTITMQVARNYFLTREKTYTRKLKEALLAFRIEKALDKNQILELYLNKIFLGHRAYGFAAAAKVYYGKPLAQLQLPEIAMLAGLPKAPSTNNPLSNPDTAIKRRNYVLNRLRELGKI
ncbi:transglycosylase domain-containing protein, partial [Pseudomonadota bacterium]